jgi:hypothetical protein
VLQVPITATVFGNYPLRTLMLNLTVVPLDGSPALTTLVQFNQVAAIGAPYNKDSIGNGNYSAVWLNLASTSLTGTITLGTLTVTVPAAPADGTAAMPSSRVALTQARTTERIFICHTAFRGSTSGVPSPSL